jgi:hypothetical protein
MMGVTRMVWAMIIAEGVNRSPSEPSGPERDQVDAKSGDDRGQPHECVDKYNNAFASVETGQRQERPNRYADERRHKDRAQADKQRQPDNRKQGRITGEDQIKSRTT